MKRLLEFGFLGSGKIRKIGDAVQLVSEKTRGKGPREKEPRRTQNRFGGGEGLTTQFQESFPCSIKNPKRKNRRNDLGGGGSVPRAKPERKKNFYNAEGSSKDGTQR